MEADLIVAQYQERMNNRRNAMHPELARSVPVNWADAPLRQTVRPGLASVPVAADFDSSLWGRSPFVLDVDTIAQALLAAHGLLRRKLDPNWDRAAREAATQNPLFARGASSGGGLYPTELYVVACGIAGLGDGVYHYAEAHSALVRIRMGHFQQEMVEALLGEPSNAESYVVISLRFWKNTFKYHSFGYQLMLQDAGSCAATIVAACRELGLRAELHHQFDDGRVGRLVGAAEEQEGPALVVGVSSANGARADPGYGKEELRTQVTELKAKSLERSTAANIPPLVLDLHKATRQAAPVTDRSRGSSRPDRPNQPASPGHGAAFHDSSLIRMLNTRESCWGRFRSYPAMQREALIQAVQFASSFDLPLPNPRGTSCVRACVLALRVDDLSRAAYQYHRTSNQLEKIGDWSGTAELLQTLYWMPNYNLDQVAAVIAIIGATKAASEAWGTRSIRTINMAAGALAQRLYLACAALSLGCGVVFGFNVAMTSDLFRLPEQEEHPLLLAFVGPRSPSAAAYDFRISGAMSPEVR